MQADEFNNFRLVGGTALSLYRGHRLSEDIDLFTDAPYGSIDFGVLTTFMKTRFNFVDTVKDIVVGMGKTYYVGENESNPVKVDVYYNDDFIYEPIIIDSIRLASEEEIIAMKIEVVSRQGRKKDFWDIHELMSDYTINEMLTLHEKRYPYSHDAATIKYNFTQFSKADQDFDPKCLTGKYWDVIKSDLTKFAKGIQL
jgi:predicted nucleotidyltransferase component of viral defense system